MRRLLDNAAAAGLAEIRLEVIVENVAARRLYAGLGFQETRELLIWRRSAEADPLPIPAERLAHAAPIALLACADRWHSRPVTWQRAAATLAHMAADGRLHGYRLGLAAGPRPRHARLRRPCVGVAAVRAGGDEAAGRAAHHLCRPSPKRAGRAPAPERRGSAPPSRRPSIALGVAGQPFG
jgi:hypothetical protein